MLSGVITAALSEWIERAAIPDKSEDMIHAVVDSYVRFILDTLRGYVGSELPISIDRNRTDEYVLAYIF